jgi:hypothetical protein
MTDNAATLLAPISELPCEKRIISLNIGKSYLMTFVINFFHSLGSYFKSPVWHLPSDPS